ncbi:MAG: sigma-54-dependent transcriptional regulator [Terriglobales bacterium]
MGNVLVCDDELDICRMLEIALRRGGSRVEVVSSGEAAVKKLESAFYDVVISDIRMPGVDGIEVLQQAATHCPDAERIVITAHEEFEIAKRVAESGGVFQYIVKGPSLPSVVAHSVQQAMEKIALRRKNFALRRDAAQRNSLDNIVGASEALQKLKQTIHTVASTSSTILICGESGTGKELVARAIHDCSPRAAEPFVSINCGAFPETLLESELFGYVRGAFTGANQNKRGLFEVANDGTIFLDEISEMSLTMQVKLLRVLQERAIRPVGGTSESAIDVRVIAATNKDLDKMVADGAFREDLYYRISVIPIMVPPLRDRDDDIVLLANHFLKKYALAMGRTVSRIDPESLDLMKGYDWPGNVRQLENTIERAVAMESSDELHVDIMSELPKARAAAAAAGVSGSPGISIPSEGIDMERYVADIERSLLQSALRRANGVQTRAAGLLSLSYRSFRHLMKKYDL